MEIVILPELSGSSQNSENNVCMCRSFSFLRLIKLEERSLQHEEATLEGVASLSYLSERELVGVDAQIHSISERRLLMVG